MVDPETRLRRRLKSFIDAALVARDRHKEAPLQPAETDFALELAALPAADAADSAALGSAVNHSYLLREQPRAQQRIAGRPLNATALAETGVAGLVLSGETFNSTALVEELAGYLAGPAVPVWDYAIIDADAHVGGPVPVIDGWEIVAPSSQEITQLVGVPSAARYVQRPSFEIDLYGGLAMLRRVDPDGEPHVGFVFYWGVRPSHALWQPLLVLSLFQNAVVHLWAQYVVEPGRRVDRLFDNVYTEPWTPDGETELERVRHGSYTIGPSNEGRLRLFCQTLAPLLDAALAQPTRPTNASRERAARLRRVAEHFVTAGEDAHDEGEVLSELNADAVLHYVIALEAVLAGGDSTVSSLTRKVVQRAAVLAGRDDPDRISVARTVRDAYAARSAYAHGSEPRNIDLPLLRRIVRDCVLARLVLGDPPARGGTLAQLLDEALLDHTCLINEVQEPVDAFWRAVDAPS